MQTVGSVYKKLWYQQPDPSGFGGLFSQLETYAPMVLPSPKVPFSTPRARLILNKNRACRFNTVLPLHITQLPPTFVSLSSFLHRPRTRRQFQAQATCALRLCDTSIMSTTTLPALPDPNDGLGGYGLPSIIRSMQKTGFRKWGFRIYRCTYDDEAAWSRYVENLENELAEGLVATGANYMLAPYHKWTIVEDREALDGAAKADVRARFREWSKARSVGRDGPGADHELVAQAGLVARFEACIMVDKECLDSMEKNKDKRNRLEPYFVVIGLDRLAPPPVPPTEEDLEELREDGEDMLEEDDEDDETWMLASCQSYVELYDELCGMGPWWRRRRAPPDIYPYF